MTTDYQKMVNRSASKTTRRKLNIGDVWANQAKCKLCGDVVRSKNRRDFRTCSCGNLAVDGGSWYMSRTLKEEDSYKEMSVMFNDV